MTLDIVRGASTKPAASLALVQAFKGTSGLAGQLFIGFPIVRTATGPQAVDALWISEAKGIVAIDLVEGDDVGDYKDRQDNAFNAIVSSLRLDRRLVVRRKLRIPVNTLSFAPRCVDLDDDGYLVVSGATVAGRLQSIAAWPDSCADTYHAALSNLQNVSTIRRSARRRPADAPRAAILKTLEESISVLDSSQSRAVVETTEGVQRIRGLAGSGKTIVLALKAAYLHALHPDWRIATTFYTRSLKDTLERLVRDFHVHNTRGEEPNWSLLEIVHAWGSRNSDGIYSTFCRGNGIEYLDFDGAKQRSRKDPFAAACQKALADAQDPEPVYDALLVDEAQDLPPAFLQLCYALLSEPKRLVYAYDELQRLSGEPMPSPDQLFGKKSGGRPRVRLQPAQDIVLHRCYRNSRPTLLTAHAIGFGIYRRSPLATSRRPHGLVQMFDQADLWRDVGYSVVDGELRDGEQVILARNSSTSPTFLEDHSPIDDLVQFHVFDNEEEQARWVVAEITKNLRQDGLCHDDIVVINPDPWTTRKKVGPIRAKLLERKIDCHLAGVDTDRDTFFVKDHPSITLSGVPRARGNEAAMVYVVNAESGVSGTYNTAGVRNRLFAAITRSKAWVRVTGIGPEMAELKLEFDQLKQNDFELRFRYPTADERAMIRTIHRDLSPEQQRTRRRTNTELRGLVQKIQRGDYGIEDIDSDIRDELLSILGGRK